MEALYQIVNSGKAGRIFVLQTGDKRYPSPYMAGHATDSLEGRC